MAGADPVRRALQRAATRILQRLDTAGFIASTLHFAVNSEGCTSCKSQSCLRVTVWLEDTLLR
jgi:hypothetical protein